MCHVTIKWNLSIGGGQIIGKDRVQLISKDNGFLSRATFTNISISPGFVIKLLRFI